VTPRLLSPRLARLVKSDPEARDPEARTPRLRGWRRAGYDGGKKLRGRKRHIVVDSMGLLLDVMVTAASADDGTAAPGVLGRLTPEHCRRRQVSQPFPRRLAGPHRGVLCGRGRRTPAGFGRVRQGPQTLGRRAHVRLDRPVPTQQPRLREVRTLGRGGRHDRLHSSHAQAIETGSIQSARALQMP